jgi:hypothetical protein
MFNRQSRQGPADDVQLGHLRRFYLGDPDATVRLPYHQPLCFKAAQRFPDRCRADPQPVGELKLP